MKQRDTAESSDYDDSRGFEDSLPSEKRPEPGGFPRIHHHDCQEILVSTRWTTASRGQETKKYAIRQCRVGSAHKKQSEMRLCCVL
jgi:hypothetical protein